MWYLILYFPVYNINFFAIIFIGVVVAQSEEMSSVAGTLMEVLVSNFRSSQPRIPSDRDWRIYTRLVREGLSTDCLLVGHCKPLYGPSVLLNCPHTSRRIKMHGAFWSNSSFVLLSYIFYVFSAEF